MCISVWAWLTHPLYPLLLFFNRDLDQNRPTKPVSWWEDFDVLGGRDCQAGGTWLACSRSGKLAFLTNFREPEKSSKARSRGELPVNFLKSDKSPLKFAEEVLKQKHHYNGFNLILADICSKSMVYVSNRPKGEQPSIEEVSPGIHVLTNAKLDTTWPKSQRLMKNFESLLNKSGEEELPLEETIEELMMDTNKADREELPITGCDPDWELALSSTFISTTNSPSGPYGTRSMIALFVKTSGMANLYEKYLDENIWKKHGFEYLIENFVPEEKFLSKSSIDGLV